MRQLPKCRVDNLRKSLENGRGLQYTVQELNYSTNTCVTRVLLGEKWTLVDKNIHTSPEPTLKSEESEDPSAFKTPLLTPSPLGPTTFMAKLSKLSLKLFTKP